MPPEAGPPAGDPRGDPRAHLARQWMLKALHDLRVSERAAQPEPLLDMAAYHAQQAAEKALKGYLASQDQPFRRTHELAELVRLCEVLDPSFQQVLDRANALTPYAVEPRYPGEPHSDPTLDEMEEARTNAQLIVDFVLQRLPPDARP